MSRISAEATASTFRFGQSVRLLQAATVMLWVQVRVFKHIDRNDGAADVESQPGAKQSIAGKKT